MLRVACLLVLAPLATLAAQRGTEGDLAGRITDTSGTPVAGSTIHVLGTARGQAAGPDGAYRLTALPAGRQTVIVRSIGFARDSFAVTITAGTVTTVLVRLTPVAVALNAVTVQARRQQSSSGEAVAEQRDAPNQVDVAAGDVIRSLPNANAADAVSRLPGVTTERAEGEGSFVEIRGTEPRLSAVTIDGMPVPGTEHGERNIKLDDVPEDILADVTVTKTLTPEMSADAIGGTVDLVTKTPDGPPHGYLSGQFGHMPLLNRVQGEAGFTYGGRVGPDERLGFLIGGSVDRNDRVINDMEPTWTAGTVPNEFSLQDDAMTRTRFGLGGDVDYRFGNRSTVHVRGLYSWFADHGTSYQYDVGYGAGTDSGVAGGTGYETNAALNRLSLHLTPTEQLYGLTVGGEQGALHYAASVAGTQQSIRHFRTTIFGFRQSATYRFSTANPNSPTYAIVPTAAAQQAADPAQYVLSGYDDNNQTSTGRDVAGRVDYAGGGWMLGASVRNEVRQYTNRTYTASYTGGSVPLSQFLSTFSDPAFYSAIHHFDLGPVPDDAAIRRYETAHRSAFHIVNDPASNFGGTEDVSAAYVRRDIDLKRLHVIAGLRVEHTNGVYTGDSARGAQTYTDLFPNLQLRYAADDQTNLRLALTRAIGRPNFSDLAPSVSGLVGDPATIVMLGNPSLRPERAWNVDLEVERFLPRSGVVSAALFYKRLSSFIYTRAIPGYDAPPYNDGQTYRGGQPQNGGDAWLAGLETQWTQHLVAGFGFSASWTHLHSVAHIPDRNVPLPRQSPDLAELAALYDRGPVSARVEWSYQGENIASYGDGTSKASTGDQYFYAHAQIDAAVRLTVRNGLELSLEGANLNNAVFGFFVGTPKNHYSFQREYYGQSFLLGLKQQF